MTFVKISDILDGKIGEGKEVKLRGWIYRTRSSGKLVFMVMRDSTGIIQVPIAKDSVGDEKFAHAKNALIESSAEIKGIVKKDSRAPGGYEIQANDVIVIGRSDVFPITKDQSEEFLSDVRHLWLRSRETTAYLKIRSTVFNAFREYLNGQGYYETQGPMFVSGACEGGATLFKVPYFEKTVLNLTQSSQMYLEAVMTSLEKVYTIAPSFRAEESRTRRHLTEFWHAEGETAWFHNEDMMKEEEKMIEFMCQAVLEKNKKELELLKRDMTKLEKIKAPFPRITYENALEIGNKNGLNLSWGADFGYEEEKAITKDFDKPLFITHYPRETKAFYHRPDPSNPKVVLNHDLLAPEGYGEIIGGGERIYELDVLLQRMKENNMNEADYGWYVDLRKYGTVPHSGFGMGLDRTVAWLAGAEHIKHVVPFPRMMRRYYP